MDNLERLLYFAGVAADYLDYSGRHCVISRDDRLRALEASGFDLSSDATIESAIDAIDAGPWRSWLKPQYIVEEHEPFLAIHIRPEEASLTFIWRIDCENGDALRGEFIPGKLEESGEYWLDQTRYSARRLTLPALAIGYHRLSVACGEREEEAELIFCPRQCFDPVAAERKYWGIICQLYTLRSARNWGIGDFADLRELITEAARLGADLVGLNPLHAPCADSADQASPYSPSDRRFLNPLYIAPELEPEYASVSNLLSGTEADPESPTVAALRAMTLVDHQQVALCKYRVYEALFAAFCEDINATGARWTRFKRFQEEWGTALSDFCEYECHHNPNVVACRSNPEFFAYLQWVAAEQFQSCQAHAIDCGMAVGLIGDLAVGAVGHGAEVLDNPTLFAHGASIGAPPDPFSDSGQDWGLPVIIPLALRESGFRHFIELLRANMAHVGALRIDHVMSLLRLWWCFPENGDQPAAGVYVYYPFREMLALVRLESHRNHCIVIGEDMGVVPPEIRSAMAESAIYGNNLFYFTQNFDHEFLSPAHHRRRALLMVTNHDVPTLADWWNGTDLVRRRTLGLINNDQALADEESVRIADRQALLRWLSNESLLPPGWNLEDDGRTFTQPLSEAIHEACGRSEATFMVVQLEDLQRLETPVNIPGTHREYPNWRRKQLSSAAEIFGMPDVKQLLASVAGARQS